jgi:hypothetical protein
LGQLPVVFILLRNLLLEGLTLGLELANDDITLLELLLDDLELLGVCEGIFRLDYFFEVGAQADALIHIHFDFDLGFVGARILDVPLEQLNLVTLRLNLEVLVAHLPL